jgi:two-component sensor histidine kinase
VRLSWDYVQSDHATVKLTWEERDGPPVKKAEKDGFGLSYIRRSTEHDLNGECQLEFDGTGFKCRCHIPADHITWTPRAAIGGSRPSSSNYAHADKRTAKRSDG